MTAIGDHCDTIRSWLNYSYSDELITSWTRMAEEDLNETLRCKHMIEIATAPIEDSRVLLPLDWQDLDFIRIIDGNPLSFRTRDKFFESNTGDENHNAGYFTVTGNYVYIGKASAENPKDVEISYYQNIPPLGDTPNWLMKYYTRLLTLSTLAVGAAYSLEDQRAVTWTAAVQLLTDKINTNNKTARYGNAPLIKGRAKGFN